MSKKKNEYIFVASSPLGREVGLSQDQMEKHISRGHPEVKENDIQRAIEDPNAIYQSMNYDDRDIYFANTPAYDKLFTEVVVQEGEKIDEIITAFYVKKIKGVKENGLKYLKNKL